jgi:hypothetical protein
MEGIHAMTTMKPVLHHAHVEWIAAGLIGVLLGMLVMVGIDHFQEPSSNVNTAAQQAAPSADLPRPDETTFYLKRPATVKPQANTVAGLRDVQAAEQAAPDVDLTPPRIDELSFYRSHPSANLDLPRLDELTFYRNQANSVNSQAVGQEGLSGALSGSPHDGQAEGECTAGSTCTFVDADAPRIIGPGEGLNSIR